MFVYWVCFAGSGLCEGLITPLEESYRMCASVCVLETSKRVTRIRTAAPQKKVPPLYSLLRRVEAYTKLNLEWLATQILHGHLQLPEHIVRTNTNNYKDCHYANSDSTKRNQHIRKPSAKTENIAEGKTRYPVIVRYQVLYPHKKQLNFIVLCAVILTASI